MELEYSKKASAVWVYLKYENHFVSSIFGFTHLMNNGCNLKKLGQSVKCWNWSMYLLIISGATIMKNKIKYIWSMIKINNTII